MKHPTIYTLFCAASIALTGCGQKDASEKEPPTVSLNPSAPRLIVELPIEYNTPDGCTLDADGNIIQSIPNFNNPTLFEQGVLTTTPPAVMVMIDKDNQLTEWYRFKPEDLHPETGKVGPMDCAFGPDGHLYLADNQQPYDANRKSRVLRINMENGKPVSTTVVATGFTVSNAVVWKGDTLFVSETILDYTPATTDEPASMVSGVVALTLDEMNAGPVNLAPWDSNAPDPHFIALYTTSGRVGFGADGLCIDAEGSLYCGIFEDGIIMKTTFDAEGNPSEPVLFAQDPEKMASCDGIVWNEADNKIYVADMLNNAVQVVDMDGNVTTLHANGDTDGADGSLDQPCEVLIRGNELIVVNMDWPWESDLLVNKTVEPPFTISAISLLPSCCPAE